MKSNLFHATRRRIVVTCISIVLACLTVFAAVIVIFYRVNLYSRLDTEMQNQIMLLKHMNQSGENLPPFGRGGFSGNMAPRMNNPRIIMIIRQNGMAVFQSENRYFSENPQLDLPEGSTDRFVNFKYDGYNFRVGSLTIGEYEIILLNNIDSEIQSFDRLLQVVLFSFLILFCVSLLLAVYLASRVIRPIQKSYEEQVHFVQDASHEMRTPLAVIKGKLELLAIHPDDTVEQHFDQVSQLMSEVRGLERLHKDLLTLSKEDVDTSIQKTEFPLSSLVKELAEFYQALAESQNKEFGIVMPSEITMVQDYGKLKQAVTILLENAFKYTMEGDRITLVCESGDRHIRVRVLDTGIGMKPEDTGRVFERFFRSDDVRGKNIEGSGIGLSLLKSLSQSIGFKISVRSDYGFGTEFILSFRMKNK